MQTEIIGGMMQMPQYQSHKKVWALKIKEIIHHRDTIGENQETDGSAMIVPEDSRYGNIRVESDYVNKHKPQAGGYYVVYEGGYKSWSPADVFESGYTLMTQQ